MQGATMSNIYEQMAQEYETLQRELEAAMEHCRVAAGHYREENVPRACAHAFAIQGHLHMAQQRLGELAKAHAEKAGIK